MSQLSGARRSGVLSSMGLAAVLAIAEFVWRPAHILHPSAVSLPSVILGFLTLLAVAFTLLWHFGRDSQILGFAEPAKGTLARLGLSIAAVMLVLHLALGAALQLQILSAWFVNWIKLSSSLSPVIAQWLPNLLPFMMLALVVMMVLWGLPGAGRAALILSFASFAAGLVQLLSINGKISFWPALQNVSFTTMFLPLIAVLPFTSLAPMLRSPRRRSLAAGFSIVVVMFAMSAWFPRAASKSAMDADALPFWLLLPLGLTLLLAMVLYFVVVYSVAAGLERQRLMPSWLIKRNSTRGAAVGIVVVMTVLVAGFSTVLLWQPAIRFGAFVHADLLLAALALMALTWRILISLHRDHKDQRLAKWIAVYAFVASAGFAFWLLSIGSWWSWSLTILAIILAGTLCAGSRLNSRLPHLRATTVEQLSAVLADDTDILTLHEAEQVLDTHHARVLVATLFASDEVLHRAMMRAEDEQRFYLLYVDELPGMLYPPQVEPSKNARALLQNVSEKVGAKGFEVIPIWRIAHDPAASIAQAAKKLQVDRVIVDPQHSRPLAEILHGQTMGRLRKLLGSVALEVVRTKG